MAASFPKTLRALQRDSLGTYGWLIGIGVVVLAAWGAWFVATEVAVVEASASARLEVVTASSPIGSEVTGRVVATNLVLGKKVAAGDVLVELDSEQLRLQLTELRARLTAIEPQLAAIGAELKSEEQALVSGGGAGRSATGAARQRLVDAEASLALARAELAPLEQLASKGAVAGVEVTRARTEVERRAAQVEAARLEANRLELDTSTTSSDRRIRADRLRREHARLTGDLESGRAQIGVLEHEIARRTLRAPVGGELASVTPLVVGGLVREGDIVGSVLPSSMLRIVALFAPANALGRVHVGQRAWMRLDGFAWTQYGALPAKVTAVGAETLDGKVRVELALLPEAPIGIPQQHGLPGTVEVEVEHVSPATLVVRAFGHYLGERRPELR
jgi:membrane fusion protein (multidrug efflux system)